MFTVCLTNWCLESQPHVENNEFPYDGEYIQIIPPYVCRLKFPPHPQQINLPWDENPQMVLRAVPSTTSVRCIWSCESSVIITVGLSNYSSNDWQLAVVAAHESRRHFLIYRRCLSVCGLTDFTPLSHPKLITSFFFFLVKPSQSFASFPFLKYVLDRHIRHSAGLNMKGF